MVFRCESQPTLHFHDGPNWKNFHEPINFCFDSNMHNSQDVISFKQCFNRPNTTDILLFHSLLEPKGTLKINTYI